MSEEAFAVLSTAASLGQSDYVVPRLFDHAKPMSNNTYVPLIARPSSTRATSRGLFGKSGSISRYSVSLRS